ncbi:MAG: CHASE2 domain-containing protein [Alphaproteobacteria bacterium]
MKRTDRNLAYEITRSWKLFLSIIIPITILSYIASTALPFLRQIENWSRDFRIVTLMAPTSQSGDIVLVLITEDTLAQFPYRSPVDRGMLADLVQLIYAAGARATGIDILFDQPSEAGKDERLLALLKSAKTPTVVAGVLGRADLTDRQRAYLGGFVGALNHGFVNISTDQIDGAVRHALTRNDGENGVQSSFSATIAAMLGVPTPEPSFQLTYHVGRGENISFPSYPAESVRVLPASWFRDKIVLIGSSLPFSDRHRTPFSTVIGSKGDLAGIEIHAHILSQILDGTRIWQPSAILAVAITALLAAIGAVTAVSRVPFMLRLCAPLAAIVGYVTAAGALFYFELAMFPIVAPVLGCFLAAATANGVFQQKERNLRQYLRNAFAKYVSPNLVEQLVENPEPLKLEGERRKLTFLFTDLEGFTSLVERSDPEVLVKLLNRYLDGMCSLVLEHGGTIDKIVGDAVVAFFGAPLPQEDQQMRAVSCAMAMDRFSEQFRNEADARRVHLGRTRIGVHSGEATIGNFGGDALFDYTAHGDAVNTAARLEGVNKYFGTRICVSEDTARHCPGLRFRPIGNVMLKGKSTPVGVAEPISASDVPEELLSRYQDAYGLLSQDPAKAFDAFAELAISYPDDSLVRFHLERLRQGAKGVLMALEGT